MIVRVALVSYGEVVEDVDLFIEVMALFLVNVNVKNSNFTYDIRGALLQS